MLDQNQFETIERARAGFITVSTEGHTPFDDRTYVAFLQQHDLTHVTNFPYKQELSGFTTAARAEVSALAKSVRAASLGAGAIRQPCLSHQGARCDPNRGVSRSVRCTARRRRAAGSRRKTDRLVRQSCGGAHALYPLHPKPLCR